MSLIQNPAYYGLVKQSGPWAETQQDKLFGQKPYKYTPNNSVTQPYIVKVSSSSPYESYVSQSIIYNATIDPVYVSQGKIKRGRVVRAKKVALVDSNGNLINPSDSYFLNKFGSELRHNNAQALSQVYGAVGDLVGKGIDPVQMAEEANEAEPNKPLHRPSSIGSSIINGIGNVTLGSDIVMAEPIVDRGAQLDANMIGADVDVPYGDDDDDYKQAESLISSLASLID